MMTGAANAALVKVQAKWLDLVVMCGVVTRHGMRGYRGVRRAASLNPL